MLKVLITGAEGQLGREIFSLHECFSQYEFYFSSKRDLDITNLKELEVFLVLNKIDIIINCAAYTNVDGAEKDKDLAFLINAKSVKGIAVLSKKLNLKLVHVSTDYVFDGKSEKPYVESVKTNPLNVYGGSKLLGESYIEEINPSNAIIIRTSWLYSSFGNNFVKTMLRLGESKSSLNVVNDQFGSPTYARDFALTILNLLHEISNTKVEIYHYSNLGSCSWNEFANEIMSIAKFECTIKPISSEDYKQEAKRPERSILDIKKIQKEFGADLRNWKVALEDCINEIKIK
jgi:dTDP-4-dehydrorhamnose reductase